VSKTYYALQRQDGAYRQYPGNTLDYVRNVAQAHLWTQYSFCAAMRAFGDRIVEVTLPTEEGTQ
jgi:hypothetical protein